MSEQQPNGQVTQDQAAPLSEPTVISPAAAKSLQPVESQAVAGNLGYIGGATAASDRSVQSQKPERQIPQLPDLVPLPPYMPPQQYQAYPEQQYPQNAQLPYVQPVPQEQPIFQEQPVPAVTHPTRTEPPVDNGLTGETVLDPDVPALGARIVMDDNEEFSLLEPVILGRNPAPQPNFPNAQLQPVRDETMRMSKTHVVIFADDDKTKIYDPGSRNGVIFDIDGKRTRIPVGKEVTIPNGAVVHIGGRFLQVLH